MITLGCCCGSVRKFDDIDKISIFLRSIDAKIITTSLKKMTKNSEKLRNSGSALARQLLYNNITANRIT